MKHFTAAALFILLSSVSFYAQSDCGAESRERAKVAVQKLEADNRLRFAVENGSFGNCVHYAWMDEMRRLGVKQVAATLDFVWNDKIEKLEIKQISFFGTYYRYDTKIKDRKILAEIETSGLKKRLEEAILERARSHVPVLIESLKDNYSRGLLKKEPKGRITGTLYHDLLDDEALPARISIPKVDF